MRCRPRTTHVATIGETTNAHKNLTSEISLSAVILKSAVPPNSGAVVFRRNSDVSGGIYRPL
jgi:hypothetical protein